MKDVTNTVLLPARLHVRTSGAESAWNERSQGIRLSPPFVRRYDILTNKWGIYYVKRIPNKRDAPKIKKRIVEIRRIGETAPNLLNKSCIVERPN